MKRKSLKRIPLVLSVGLLLVLWGGSAVGFPGFSGLWQGFHAEQKGFPGPTRNDQHRIPGAGAEDASSVETLRIQAGSNGSENMHYNGFAGTQMGQYPGQRPEGR